MRGVIIVLLISILLVISSCQTNTTGTNIGGVDMRFEKDQPPLGTIRDGQGFNVGIVLTNSLPRQVNDAKLCIYDIVPEAVGGITGVPCATVSLPAAEKSGNQITPAISDPIYFPESGGTYAYNVGSKGIDSTTINAELTYTADSAYTIKSACFKRKPELKTDFPCETQETFSGSNIVSDVAPVTITKIEKNIYPEGTENRLVLTLYMNRGSGEVIWNQDETKNLMDIKISSSDTQSFTCTPNEDGLINFDEATKTITCESKFPLSQDSYTDSINIELYYKYKVRLSSGPITIQKEGSSV